MKSIFFIFFIVVSTTLVNAQWQDAILSSIACSEYDEYSTPNSILVDAENRIHVTYLKSSTFTSPPQGQVYYRFKDPVSSWSEPLLLSEGVYRADNPQIYCNPIDGSIYIVYEAKESLWPDSLDYNLAANENGQWEISAITPEKVPYDPYNPFYKMLFQGDSLGNLHILWNAVLPDSTNTVNYATRIDGYWDFVEVPVDTTEEYIFLQCFAVSPDGGAYFVYDGPGNYYRLMENEGLGSNQWRCTEISSPDSTNYISNIQVDSQCDLYLVISGYTGDPWWSPPCYTYLTIRSQVTQQWSPLELVSQEWSMSNLAIDINENGHIVFSNIMPNYPYLYVATRHPDGIYEEFGINSIIGTQFRYGNGIFIDSENKGHLIFHEGIWSSVDEFNWDVYYYGEYPEPLAVQSKNDLSPKTTELFTCYPNPFNASTIISFQLPAAGSVKLNIFDITGREIAKLVDGYKSAGHHQIEFNASQHPSGVYFARLQAGDLMQTGKMLLIK